jgi:Domain of unknown function (DUF4386)
MISTKQTAIAEGTNDMNAARKGVKMDATRKTALAAGVLFLITFITSIPAQFVFYHALLTDPAKYILGTGTDASLSMGALLEVMLAIAGVGTAVVLYPITKRQNQAVALAYVTSRLLESALIMVGIVSVLSVLSLRQHVAGTAGADTASLIIAGKSLVAIHDTAFLLGPTLLAGVGNGCLLGYLMYRSGLVPRRMALLGLIGGPLVIIASVCVLFGVFKAGSSWQAIATGPEFIWELSFGVYLTVKGFNPSPITSVSERTREAA